MNKFNRRDFLKTLGGGITFLSLPLSQFGCSKQPEKPNILFLFADDQSFRALHAFDNSEIKTPNLDRLAARGVRFTHAYNMGSWSGAVCMPSRMMLNKGRFLWKCKTLPAYRNEQ